MNEMEDFNDLESLYKCVEDQVITDRNLYQITDLFMELRDAKQNENSPGEAEKAQWEIDFLSFVLREGEIGPQCSRIDENGQGFVYPHLNLFNEKTYEYLITRLDATNNPKLKAQYAHILWCSPKKHKKFAKIAIDSYLELISVYEQRNDDDIHLTALEISEVVINAHSIARQTKEHVERIKSEFKSLVQKFSSVAPSPACDLIQFALKPKNGFTKDDFNDLADVCWQMAESFATESMIEISFLTLGEEITRRLSKKSYKWIQRIAQNHEARMKLFEKHPHAAFNFCMKAIENYKKIGDEDKVKELERRYSELKDSMEFGTSRVDVDLTEIVKPCKELAKEIVKNATPEDIIRCLIWDKNLLPTYQEVEESLKERIKKSPTPYLLPKVVLDQNVNTAQYFDSQAERKYFDILSAYKLKLELLHVHLIKAVLFEAILAKKLNFNVLIDFITKYCWFGKDPSERLPKNMAVNNWLELIAPALNQYFLQMNFFFADPKTNVPNFVLSIDSLTLKFEGLFRDLCQRFSIVTTYQKEDSSGRNIVQEKDLNVLLRQDAMRKLFDEDDLLFFKFLLIEKLGYNLRHRIAHSLMLFQEYSADYMHLVILALLRLGKFDFTLNNDGVRSYAVESK